MDNSWECEHCDEVHEKPDECCFCYGEGHDEGQYCSCPTGVRLEKEATAEWAWMAPLAKQYNRAKREGDEETAAAIKAEVDVRK